MTSLTINNPRTLAGEAHGSAVLADTTDDFGDDTLFEFVAEPFSEEALEASLATTEMEYASLFSELKAMDLDIGFDLDWHQNPVSGGLVNISNETSSAEPATVDVSLAAAINPKEFLIAQAEDTYDTFVTVEDLNVNYQAIEEFGVETSYYPFKNCFTDFAYEKTPDSDNEPNDHGWGNGPNLRFTKPEDRLATPKKEKFTRPEQALLASALSLKRAKSPVSKKLNAHKVSKVPKTNKKTVDIPSYYPIMTSMDVERAYLSFDFRSISLVSPRGSVNLKWLLNSTTSKDLLEDRLFYRVCLLVLNDLADESKFPMNIKPVELPTVGRKKRTKAETPSAKRIQSILARHKECTPADLSWLVRVDSNNLNIDHFANDPHFNPGDWVYCQSSDIESILHFRCYDIKRSSNWSHNAYDPRVRRILKADLQLLFHALVTNRSEYYLRLLRSFVFKRTEALCPYCEYHADHNNNNDLDFYFHRLSDSDYLHHMLKHHGVHACGLTVPQPDIVYHEDDNCWYAACKECPEHLKLKDFLVRGKQWDHQYLNFLRHVDQCHKKTKILRIEPTPPSFQ